MGAYPRLVKSNALEAKRRFGQHFLRDTGVIERIGRWIRPSSEDIMLEIGAGNGALSQWLAPRVKRFLAIEIDADCLPGLEQILHPIQGAEIVHGDFLDVDLSWLASRFLDSGQSFRIIGNLPYNIATAIIEKLLLCRLPILDMFFMVQLEVAQRITAQPGSRQYGYLSVNCQHHCQVQMGFKVSAGCFVPRPKIDSAMVSFRPKKYGDDPGFESDFQAICKAAFGHRRKILANALAKHSRFERHVNDLLARACIGPSRRAEELSVREYEHLAAVYRLAFKGSDEITPDSE